MFGFLSKNKNINKSPEQLFSLVIEQTRLPVFYTEFKIEDTLDGRFDLMSLHMALLLGKIDQHEEHENFSSLKRRLQEVMFDNLDLTVREIGVGDMSVGKKVKVMAEAFYGRMIAYQKSLNAEDQEGLKNALRRNLYREKEMSDAVVDKVSDYVFLQWKHICSHSIEQVMADEFSFLKPEAK